MSLEWDRGCVCLIYDDRTALTVSPWMLQFPSMYLTWGYEIVMMGYALEQDMHEYATRRSAVEFMPQLMGASAAASQHADMLQSLATEADEYDEDVLRHFHEQKRRPPRVFPPKGMPRTHWWWWMRKPGLP